jgi:hypothetical protein
MSETLAGDAGARITWCPECESFHLVMGFVQIRLTAEQFNHLHLLINKAMLSVNLRREHEASDAHAGAAHGHGLH